MPFYRDIDTRTDEGQRTVERLLELREALSNEIPQKTLNETLLLATWNIRDFDKSAYGDRLEESIYYIAEIIAHFDIVAVQEVYKDLKGLRRVMKVLGSDWDYLITDVTEGGRGNKERMAFVYDSRKVKFGGLAGEVVLPPIRDQAGNTHPASQIWRTPFICGFRAGWSRFMLSTVHITWGASEAEPEERIEEIRQVAQFLKKRTQDDTAWARNLILLGDFNIFEIGDETYNQLDNAGFEIPEVLQQFRSNAGRNRHYDQIAFRTQPGRLEKTGKAGVFDFFQTVFREEDQVTYVPSMGDAYNTKTDGEPRSDSGKRTYYKTYWRTHQMSDHLPMWVELKIDYSDEYLQRKLQDV